MVIPVRSGQVKKRLLVESRPVRFRRSMKLARWLPAASAVVLVLAPASAQAQVNVTPNFSITPTSSVTKWIMWMALGAIILAVLVLVAVGTSYLRFAPKFYGREEPPKRLPPGARPSLLPKAARPQAAVGASRPSVPQSASARTATAVAERPAAPPAPALAAAKAPAPTQEAPAEAQEAPAEEAAAPAAAAPAPAAEAPPGAAPEAAPQPAEHAGQAASHGGASALDQETFDRVLEEQLGKGVDRRVAEGRARAAAVVAARKKAQG